MSYEESDDRQNMANELIQAGWRNRLDECRLCHVPIFSMAADDMPPSVRPLASVREVWWFHNSGSSLDSGRRDMDHLPVPMLLIEEEP